MRLGSSMRKTGRQAEPLLPMIDVVFFLIVFFMMVSRFAEPEPFPLERPLSAAEADVAGEVALYISVDGEPAARGETGVLRGDEAIVALVARCAVPCGPVLIHADAAAPASAVAGLLPKLAAAGLADLRLVTVRE